MQLINNDCDIDLDVLNDYNWHIIGPLRDLYENFNTSTNIFLWCVLSNFISSHYANN